MSGRFELYLVDICSASSCNGPFQVSQLINITGVYCDAKSFRSIETHPTLCGSKSPSDVTARENKKKDGSNLVDNRHGCTEKMM